MEHRQIGAGQSKAKFGVNPAAPRLGAGLAALGIALAATAARAQIYVDDDAPPGGDGRSWQTAFQDVQSAFDAINGGRRPRVYIAQGRYSPNPTWVDDRRSFVLSDLGVASGATVVIRAGFAGLTGPGNPNERDPARFVTIFDGDIDQDDMPGDEWSKKENSKSVLLIDVPEPVELLLSGVTIMNGFSDSWSYFGPSGGAAIRSLGPIALRLGDCTFRGNEARTGGALMAREGRIEAVRCTFEDNSGTFGGAVGLTGEARAAFDRCIFRRNRANVGGGVYASLINGGEGEINFGTCLLAGNEGEKFGGAICMIGGTLTMGGCTLWENRAAAASEIFLQGTNGRITSTVAWGTPTTTLVQLAGTVFFEAQFRIDQSIVRGGTGAIARTSEGVSLHAQGLIDADPLLVDPLGPDGLLASGDEDFNPTPLSPAINAGNRTYQDQYVLVAVDLDGDPRSLRGVDIGAYEMRCLADLTGSADDNDPWFGVPDGFVNDADFDYFLLLFERGDPAIDLSGSTDPAHPLYTRPDGVVDMTDFFRFLDDLANPCYP